MGPLEGKSLEIDSVSQKLQNAIIKSRNFNSKKPVLEF